MLTSRCTVIVSIRRKRVDFDRLRKAMNSRSPQPLHTRLRDGIQAQLIDGLLRPGDKLPSERVLQDELGVSRSTVRQALNVLIQDGFLQSQPGSGTFVLEHHQRAAQPGAVGIVVSRPNFHFFYPELVAAFSDRLQDAGYSVILSMHNDRAEMFARIQSDFVAQNIRALAITPPRNGDMSLVDTALRELDQSGIPTVLIGRRSDRYMNIDSVAPDNRAIGYQAARHLIELGHQRIWHIGFLDYSTAQDRFEGYRQAMIEAGLEPVIFELAEYPAGGANGPHNYPHSEHLANPAYYLARDLLANQAELPTALFCFNDVVAMGVYKALREMGLRIPDSMSLISVDNLITVQHFEVPLTTFALPGEMIGRKSASLLLERLSGSTAPAQLHLLAATLLARQSTAPPR